MADHDNGYKLLFSHAPLVEDLIRGFIREDWVGGLDFTTLLRVGGGYVSDYLRDRESDVVWRVRWGEEEWIYVYLLLEFQSTVDTSMALRVMTYLGLLYQDLERLKLLTPSGRLPPVLPVVLYNGHRPWRASLDMADLVEPVPQGLERYRPSLRYCLLDELRLAESELPSVRNLAAALFRLERSQSAGQIGRVVAALADWLREPELAGLRRAFTAWLSRVVLPSRLPGEHIPEMVELQEVRAMLPESEPRDLDDDPYELTEEEKAEWAVVAQRIRRYAHHKRMAAKRRDVVERGLDAVLADEREETLQKIRPVALHLLEQRFGALPEPVRVKVEAMSADELASVLDRVLQVQTLADLGLEERG